MSWYRYSQWSFSFLLAVAFIAYYGYQFNTNDQAEHLPQVYQLLDDQLYPHDYFVNASNSVFTVRFYYEYLALFLEKTIGLELGAFVSMLASISLLSYSLMQIAYNWFKNQWSVFLAPVFALFVFHGFTVGGNHIMYPGLISGTIAIAFAAPAIYLVIIQQYVFGGILLGFATLFQPLVGFQLFLVFGGIQLLIRRDWKSVLQFGIPYLVVAAFILIPIFSRQFGETMHYDKELYYEILYRFRNHHHYVPSLFPLTHYIKFFGLLGLGLLSYYLTKPQDKKFYLGFVSLGLLGMLFYWLGLEHLGLLELGKVQWFKTTVWMGAFSSIMIAGLLGQLITGFVSIFKFRKRITLVSLPLCLLLLFAITNSKCLPESFQGKYMIGNRNYSDLEKMHFWIAENTPKDISVLVSPDNNAFGCQAKRSMPIHYQAIIHEPFFMLPWYENFKTIYGVSMENLDGIDARAHAVKLYQRRNYRGEHKRIDYRLDNLETCQFSDELGPIFHQEGNWILTEFLPE